MRRAVAELAAVFMLVGGCAFRDWLNLAAAAVLALLALVEVLRELADPGATVTRPRLPSRPVRSAAPADTEVPPFAWLTRKTADEEPPRDT